MSAVRVTVRIAPVDCWSCGAEFKIVPSIELVRNGSKLECCVSDFTDYPDLIQEVQENLPGDAEVGQLKSRYTQLPMYRKDAAHPALGANTLASMAALRRGVRVRISPSACARVPPVAAASRSRVALRLLAGSLHNLAA